MIFWMIDVHVHVVPPNLPGVGSLSGTLRLRPDVVASALRSEMRAAGIELAFAMGEWNVGGHDPLGIMRTLQIAEMVPGLRAIGIADPTRGDDPEHLKQVEAVLATGRVAALKCYLGYLHFEPAHPNYRRYYELAAKFKLPVYFHTGDTYSAMAKLKYAHPLGVDEVAVDIKEAGAVFVLMDDMGIPDLVIERFGGHGGPLPFLAGLETWLGVRPHERTRGAGHREASTVRAAP